MQSALYPNFGHSETVPLMVQEAQFPGSMLCCPCSLWYSRAQGNKPCWKATPECTSTLCSCISYTERVHLSILHGSTRGSLGNLCWSAGLEAENWLEDDWRNWERWRPVILKYFTPVVSFANPVTPVLPAGQERGCISVGQCWVQWLIQCLWSPCPFLKGRGIAAEPCQASCLSRPASFSRCQAGAVGYGHSIQIYSINNWNKFRFQIYIHTCLVSSR